MRTNQNRLIELLPRKDRLHLLAVCEPVKLILGSVLCEPGSATWHVYFPVDSFISLLARVGWPCRAAARNATLPLRAHVAIGFLRRMPALSLDRSTPCPLAVDEPGPRPQRLLPCNA